jgi:hypothetical protein
MTTKSKRPVVVTTEHKGVFFGHVANDHDDTTESVFLTDAQMCVYWDTNVKGVLGLAATGPTSSCKVTAPVPSITLRGVTAVMGASPSAVKAWEAKPWR